MRDAKVKTPKCLTPDNDYELWWLIHHIRRVMHKARARELAPLTITPIEAAVMHAICRSGRNATPAQIARFVVREPHSISCQLERMERRGLVQRFNDLDQKNRVRFELTDKGKEIYDKAADRQCIHRIMSGIKGKEREALKRGLLKLYELSLKEVGKARPPFPPVE